MRAAVCLTVTFLLTAIAASDGVTVTVERSGGKACGQSVALTCLLTWQDESLIVIEFSWMLNQTQGSTKVLCSSNEKVEGDGIGCEYENNSLVLTIEDVQQSNNGVYICKALTSAGHDSEEYTLNITDCEERVNKMKSDGSHQIPNRTRAEQSKRMSVLVWIMALWSLIWDSSV